MRRVTLPERPEWRELAAALGFRTHTTAVAPYWTDGACYVLDAEDVETRLRKPTQDLWDLCLHIVDRACRDEEILRSLQIPEVCWDALRASRLRGDPSLVTRFDFAHDGVGPAKLHECNGDTPGVLFEAAVFQWIWLEDRLAAGALSAGCDQFNRLHEALVAAIPATLPPRVHVTASRRNIEDQVWARYLVDCARQAGRDGRYVDIEAIGVDAGGRLTDGEDRPIEALVKAYRWDVLIGEPFAPHLLAPTAPAMVEPLWKLVLASKGLLVWLWRLFPGHPNLLPCWFADDPAAPTDDCAIKPVFSIKGHNVTLRHPTLPGGEVATSGPRGAGPRVVQALHRLPAFPQGGGAVHATVQSWIVGGRAEGIGILECDGPIVHDETSRFVPHVVAP